jgi:acyl carrier protein
MKTIYQRVAETVISIGITEREIHLKACFSSDLGLDSIDMAELITLWEAEFEIHIPDSALYRFVRVGDVVEYVQAKLNPSDKPNQINEEVMISKIAAFVGISRFRKLD